MSMINSLSHQMTNQGMARPPLQSQTLSSRVSAGSCSKRGANVSYASVTPNANRNQKKISLAFQVSTLFALFIVCLPFIINFILKMKKRLNSMLPSEKSYREDKDFYAVNVNDTDFDQLSLSLVSDEDMPSEPSACSLHHGCGHPTCTGQMAKPNEKGYKESYKALIASLSDDEKDAIYQSHGSLEEYHGKIYFVSPEDVKTDWSQSYEREQLIYTLGLFGTIGVFVIIILL